MIEAVRVMGEDGEFAEYAWTSATWYSVRDDCPYLDILVCGHGPQATDRSTKLEKLPDAAQQGSVWHRWNLESELARQRRFGEVTLPLKVPKDTTLRGYVIPTALLRYRDVIAMIENIEDELGITPTWDIGGQRPERSWVRKSAVGSYMALMDLIRTIESELRSAHAIRREPFSELCPRVRRDVPLPENAIVSHWASKRHGHLRRTDDEITTELKLMTERASRHNPSRRMPELDNTIRRLDWLRRKAGDLKGILSRLTDASELRTGIHPGPVFQRDHRLRHLLGAFAPRRSEAISVTQSERSTYPPIFLNSLWELWGAVWLAKKFRRWGFDGSCHLNRSDRLHSCSWRMKRGEIEIEFDYEAHPTFVDYRVVPPVHERGMPALEWAAAHQSFDPERPYFGLEEKCSPDYLIRISSPSGRFLMVGDACLASPKHHGRTSATDSKPYTVESYRRTVGWATDGGVVRCHSLGGFVLFPPPADDWVHLEMLPGVRDCTLLCPSPLGDETANARLARLLTTIMPGFVTDTP